jgi:hypothetical protein
MKIHKRLNIGRKICFNDNLDLKVITIQLKFKKDGKNFCKNTIYENKLHKNIKLFTIL